ncbi:hypothetical protein GUITHDRAFT_107245 [Guillardia theta CCMP2712]|uniref:beta-N-acetylhexosaminidase n=1 Tax=Guillardia theta (strain CCMP2712) TaxID=905079 RepID=L1JFH4_GUITC|nr:hypothetical protein GUITHDRAFT_107245 [Guillardia theta CCMP2712]EKX46889.1 hypothetical protein GUITHDRAFT_107245 [Guillardia theta CCMP2712]|eukprot:XP_005833869.1 hypothetical protein GUITHDRAFT_107245 [Guillardia theta CCMP2712]
MEEYEVKVGSCEVCPMDQEEDTNSSSILISVGSAVGLVRSVETVVQLLRSCGGTSVVPFAPISISDRPQFDHRGLLLDTSRNFIPVPLILETLDAMSMVKLNVLHWHIVDATSFPLRTRRFQQLSGWGAYSNSSVYDAEDVRAVVESARQRGVRVIPEIDMPGHAFSWTGVPDIVSCAGKQPWELYCAEPPCGQLDPTKDETFEVVRTVLEEVTRLFPDRAVHIGGDEVNYRCWDEDAALKRRMRQQGFQDFSALWQFFEDHVLAFTHELGRRAIVWQDVLDEGLQLPSGTIVQVGRGGKEGGRADEQGFDVVVSNADAWYLDCGSGSFIDGGRSWCDPFKSWEVIYSNEPCEVDETNLHQKIWPRAAAAAERLWSSSSVRDLGDARRRLSVLRERMKARGIPASPLHPAYCHEHPGSCDSHAAGQEGSSRGVVDFPASASETYRSSKAARP